MSKSHIFEDHLASKLDVIPADDTKVDAISTQDYFSWVAQSMTDSLVVFGSDGRIAAVNNATLEMLGYTEDELIGQVPDILFEGAASQRNGLETLHERGIIERSDKVFRTKDGRAIPVLYSGSLLYDDQGQVKGVVCVAHDTTKQKQLEQQLRLALQKDHELLQLKSQLIATISHEFRTPLSIIMMNCELLRRDCNISGSENAEMRYTTIKKQIKHMVNMVEDTLRIEKLQEGHIPVKPVPVDLQRMCNELVKIAQNRTQREFSVKTEGTAVETLLDEGLTQQFVTNLISNAIKYSETDSKIEIVIAYNTDCVTLSVRDHGIGIPKADQLHIFEPFQRAANAETISGTGLGLAIVKQAVELHHGTISVESEQGKGSVFTVKLPINPDKHTCMT